jgi:hypothetical protein
MSSTTFNDCLDMSDHGALHLLKGTGVVAVTLTGIYKAMVKRLFVVNRSCIHKGF